MVFIHAGAQSIKIPSSQCPCPVDRQGTDARQETVGSARSPLPQFPDLGYLFPSVAAVPRACHQQVQGLPISNFMDFRNAVVVLTSNIGSQYIDLANFDEEEVENKMMEALREHFRPEFLNRIDDIIVFHPLRESEIEKIVEIQLRNLEKLLNELKIHLKLTKGAKGFLAKQGYDPVYGARPLKRAIQTQILDPMAQEMIARRISEGDSVMADVADGKVVFAKAMKKMEGKQRPVAAVAAKS